MTTVTKQRVALWTLILMGAGAVYAALAVLSAAMAHADPVADATAATDAGYSVVATHGWLGGALMVYAGLATFLKANETKHWIAQGRWLAILTGIGMIGGALAAWKFNAAPIGAVLEAALGAIALLRMPTVRPVVAAPVPSPEAPAA